MGQEFIIKSQNLEDKINQLLPSQGGFQAGVDLSASTTIIPIVDLTESAEGSNLRVDLQSALAHGQVTNFNINNASNTVIVNTTGYFRVFGCATTNGNTGSSLNLFDGTTSKTILAFNGYTSGNFSNNTFDFLVFIEAGHSLRGTSANANSIIGGCTRQIADLQGNLINP